MALNNFKNLGDQLTTEEYNGIISLYRHFTQHNEQIQIQNNTTGEYAEYLFDIENTTILDTGILITNQTITAQPTIKLTQPLFPNSTYTLTLQIIKYNGANILDDNNTNYKTITNLEIELIPDTWVHIPVENLENGNIISFNANINIKHDKTIIGD